MDSVVVGSGWHIPLFSIETSSLLNISSVNLSGINTRFLQLQTPPLLIEKLSTASTVDDIYSPGIFNFFDMNNPVEEVRSAFKKWLAGVHIDSTGQSVAVRALRIGKKRKNWSSSQLAGVLGSVLSAESWQIDLDNPTVEIGLAIDTETSQIAWGIKKLKQAPRQGWSGRTPTKRPFFKPVSMDPRHAILMANLVRGEGCIVDPMTGTGGFLVEAAFSQISAIGIDVDSEMIIGAQKNLEWAKEQGAKGDVKLIRGDSTELPELLKNYQGPFTGIVFDPPYGRNSQGTEAPIILFKKILGSSRLVVENGSNLACLLPCDPRNPDIVQGRAWDEVVADFASTGWEVLGKWNLPVHASLERLLILAKTV